MATKINQEFNTKRAAIQFLCAQLPNNGIIYNDCAKLMNGTKTPHMNTLHKGEIYRYENVSKRTQVSIYKTKQSRYSEMAKEVRHNCTGYMVQIEIA